MKKKLIYRGPEPSHATRVPARRSKGSLRGSMVALLPGFERPRIIHFESALEYAFLCLMLVREDVHHIREQPPAISYVGADGRPRDMSSTSSSPRRMASASQSRSNPWSAC
ncbi:hypothetical protein GCM10011415_14870 [Salipiger pallidus]|uniref:Uncharacterized protein n=1 Tax=Salipiger pallidus TaxID=1775170 RepID=A0A8J3EF97_9RHOB|nr:hypothetical protein [Salipiger pallidus]GGG68674.1 hypothetical protein GCM10011415_14870 [Salipiger pallidus]